MMRPGIERKSPEPVANTLPTKSKKYYNPDQSLWGKNVYSFKIAILGQLLS